MDTSVISHRVADFLKKHPPFHAMDDGDLLALAARGRVRFHEANDFIVWQGEPHKQYVFVIQQGTVSLWDEADGQSSLRDVRGAGDMLAIERFNLATHAPRCLHSARSESDVVIYAFPASDFDELVLKYPYARQFVEAYDTVAADYQWAKDARAPQSMFLNDVIDRRPHPNDASGCRAGATIRELAQSLLTTGSNAVAVVDGENRVQGVVTTEALLAWVAAGAGSAEQPIGALVRESPPAVGSAATITDAVLAIAEAGADALAMTSDGSPNGRLHRLVTPADIGRAFGDQPIAILRGILLAATTAELRELNHRARSLALQYLTSAPSVDWLARFLSLADKQIVQRLIALTGDDPGSACWCFCGAAGRAESLTRHAPQLVLIVEDEGPAHVRDRFELVSDALADCDYLSRADGAFERSFPRARRVASRTEWRTRYTEWLRDPVRSETYLARPLFDLRPVHGNEGLWRDLQATVVGGVDRDLLQVLANDCLASLPPLTFFENAVVEESGEQMTVFRLEHSALRPLVDVGRVFGMATGKVLGTSTRERLACARRLLPEHESVFREASDTFRILLWQQARIGIGQGTDGSELPPALLSRHDRHVLKSGFRSILRLVELTGNSDWFQTA